MGKFLLKPVVKWAGGKTRILNQLAKYFPHHYCNYHEPFMGGGAVFFHLFAAIKAKKTVAYLSDSNEELINLYQVIRDDVETLITVSKEHIYDHQYFYDVRAQNPLEMSDVQRASRTLYLNKTCFNGLYRVNSKGQFNVPFGDYTAPVIVNEAALRQASCAFRQAELYAGDFGIVLENARAGDFVYLDPPYVPLSPTSNFTSYTAGSFGLAEHRRLREVFGALQARGCYVMLSNSQADFVTELYHGCNIKTINAIRAINSVAAKRGPIKELVILSYPDQDMCRLNHCLK